ncbi:type II secretion system F family protein [Tessaracoccus sp. OS52]|uniref:type II secretion system F family protein n=1 Tax=Tessaracoccus sp. OS52 TaxID=2886691 RepID=UPI001D10CF4F|nr:type II secretion system F family protein [Tessaracoccus sp. OS52]MCC2594137.1 type II secretion system F family protein [Tessaracoccus sp. OS52]
MPPIVIIAVVGLAGSLSLGAWLLLAGADPVHQRSTDNLNRGLPRRAVPQETAASGAKSVLVAWLATPSRRGRIERLLNRAGRPEGWTVSKVMTAKLLLPAVMGFLAYAIATRTDNLSLKLLFAGFVVLAFYLPEILLYNRGIKRREAIDLELADMLDQMSIAVSAGLGFDAAMMRVARNGRGILPGELLRTMQDIQVGQTRRQAYDELNLRAGSVPLRRFLRTVVQAEAYGIPFSDILHTQADEMRKTRRANAERKAMEIPVKITLPLIITILPVLFIVIMGPAAIKIVAIFSGM